MIGPVRRARRRAITAATPIPAMVLMQLLVGCGGDVSIATSTDVEQNMLAYLRREAGRPIESVDCPDGKRSTTETKWLFAFEGEAVPG